MVVILDTPCSEVVWRVLATHSIRQFPLHFPSRASPCAIMFQLDSTELKLKAHSVQMRRSASKGRSHATKTCVYSQQTFHVCNPDSQAFVIRPWSLALAIQKPYGSKFRSFRKILPQALLKVSEQSVFSSTTPEISCWAPCVQISKHSSLSRTSRAKYGSLKKVNVDTCASVT